MVDRRERLPPRALPRSHFAPVRLRTLKCRQESDRGKEFAECAHILSFRLGVTDEILAKEFYPEFSVEDLISLPNYDIYLKLMIDGQVSKPFSARRLPVKMGKIGPCLQTAGCADGAHTVAPGT